MRAVFFIVFTLQIGASLAAEQKLRNLTWFDAKGPIASYRSSDGKGGQRPKIVLFSHDWDLISNLLKTKIVEKLKSSPKNNPILLDADCTDSKESQYFKILTQNGIRNLPIIGVHTESGWKFFNPESEYEQGKVRPEIGPISHLVEAVTAETDG